MAGTLAVRLFRISENRVIDSFSCPAAVLSGESSVLTSLYRFGYFRRDCVLHAALYRDGEMPASAVGYVDMERHLPFPQARLSLAVEGDELIVSTDSFARCVELSGLSGSGDRFGWHFEDNYFDLLPFETRRVHIGGKHKSGQICAKAHYSQNQAEIHWRSTV